MTLPYLPDDCIYYILQHLQNDRSTLFNCLLVNRFWCKSTIPLLYANPFVNITEKNYPIILTLIFCFNKAEILQLKNQLGPSQINNINFDKEYKPLFEYPKYLENYNHFTINSVINRCFVGYCSDLSISQNKIYDDIIPIFHKSILRQSRNIKQIDILLHLFYKESFKNFNIKNFTSNLTKLNSLSLTFHLNGTFINNEIEQEFLTHIEFTKCDFNIVSLKSFSNLYNLKYLTFESCKGTILLDQCEILNFASLKLKELSFKRNNWNVDVTSLMIKYLGESLQRLILIENLTIPVVENISMYCPNLVFLRIRIDNSFNLLVLPYLKNLRISILNINISYYNSNNVNEIFINLANNIPINII
ncbi:15211_t:CDS:2 [Rhizophagus irregularis]|nr:15211_t:CDS:2 [Rhizophagus irregularis]